MDIVAFADAKILLTAGMTAILLETDSEDALKKVFNVCLDDAHKGYVSELNRTNRQRQQTGEDVEILRGPAVTRELWIGMISKYLKAFGTGPRGEADVRKIFDAMFTMAKERVEATGKAKSR